MMQCCSLCLLKEIKSMEASCELCFVEVWVLLLGGSMDERGGILQMDVSEVLVVSMLL